MTSEEFKTVPFGTKMSGVCGGTYYKMRGAELHHIGNECVFFAENGTFYHFSDIAGLKVTEQPKEEEKEIEGILHANEAKRLYNETWDKLVSLQRIFREIKITSTDMRWLGRKIDVVLKDDESTRLIDLGYKVENNYSNGDTGTYINSTVSW